MWYDEIYMRMRKAEIFHSEMADIFMFLGFIDWHKLHVRQFKEETKEQRRFKEAIMRHYGELVIQKNNLAEDDKLWFVGYYEKENTAVALKKLWDRYLEYEKETCTTYEYLLSESLKNNDMKAFSLIKPLLVDVLAEIKKIKSIINILEAIGYDVQTIISMQKGSVLNG